MKLKFGKKKTMDKLLVTGGAGYIGSHIVKGLLEKIDKLSTQVFNLGSEKGFLVKEIIEKAEVVTQKKMNIKYLPCRVGDISVSVASSQKAREKLGWKPENSNLDSIIASGWHWRKNHPFCYT